MELRDAIKTARKLKGLSQEELAAACGWPKTNNRVSNYERGLREPDIDDLKVLAKALGYQHHSQLVAGAMPSTEGSQKGNNFEPTPVIGTDVPLISWVQAGAWCDAADPFQPGDAESWYPCPKKHGPRTFALRVRGPSMFNKDGKPSFEEGDIIFIDPDAEPQPNSRVMQSCVIVRLEDRQEATFKQLITEGEQRWLKALNRDWPEQIIKISSAATICGACIGKWVD